MKLGKQRQTERYTDFMNAVYNGEKANTRLCRIYQISTNTVRALRELKFIDDYGFNNMTLQPNRKMVNLVMNYNKQIHKEYKDGLFPKPISKPVKKPNVSKTPIMNTKTSEINLFWGMIKIIK